jgi:ATP-dependent protease Clp ATPase subunit
MTDDPAPKLIVLICDFCGKRDTEVRKMIAGTRPDGQEAKICNECLSLCMSIMMIEDREWFEKEVEDIKSRLG